MKSAKKERKQTQQIAKTDKTNVKEFAEHIVITLRKYQ